ncbi:uncharacterized protein LOC133906156 isoform X2 [Phragmites australis]|uniref:uncharacterized protein LOC133906156 isoform X2 n=1 Tax=Phragmites australis TaxID=29695 RepID=UPI002D79F707|nr:uncharacterized protein LOC133906156 isoform X2 [Phragmites australis]
MDFERMKRRELQALCKRHGLPAVGSNADLAARLAAALSGDAGAEEVVARKGCLKRSGGGSSSGDLDEVKRVTFALEEEVDVSGRGLRPRLKRGSRMTGKMLPAEQVSGRGRQRKLVEVPGDCADDDGVAGVVGADAPVRRSSRNAVKWGAVDGVESHNNSAMADEEGEEVVREATDRKRKRKTQENAVSAQVGISSRVTRRSSLSEAALLLPRVVERKKGRRKAGNGKDELGAEEQAAKVQDLDRTFRSGLVALAGVSPVVVESKRSTRKGGDYEHAAQMSAKAEVSARTTRSRSVAAAVMSPTVVENKRRKTEDVHLDGETPTILEVPRNDAPVFRSLRNRVVQVNNCLVEETHVGKKLENKRQPSRPATRWNQQLSVEEEDQEHVAAPSKCPPLRRSGRNKASNANSETNKSSSAPVEAKDSNIARPLICHNAKSEDVEKQPAVKEPVRRSTRKSVVSAMLEKGDKDLIAEKRPEAHVRRSMRKSVVPVKDIKGVGEEIHNANGEVVAKQPAVKEPVRRSTLKSVVSAMLEKEKDLSAEKNPRRSMRKSVVPVKDIKGVSEEIQNAKDEGAEKQLVVKQPVRLSSRKSVPSDMLEKEIGFLVAETDAKAHVRRSMQKSILPNMLNKENQAHNKMDRKDFQSGKGGDEEKQLKVKEPVRRSVATVVLEKENKGLHEEKKSEIPMGRSTRKSVALNVVEKGNMDHTEMVGWEQSRVGTRNLKARVQLTDCALAVATSENNLQVEVAVQNNQGLQRSTRKSSNHNLSDDNKAHPGPNKYVSCERVGEEGMKLRKRRRSSMEISSPANDSWNTEGFGGQKFRKEQSAQTPNGKDNTGTNHEKPLKSQKESNSTTSKGRPAKRRKTTAPEEVMSVEEAKSDDMVISEATQDGDKVAREYSKESSSKIQEICQVNATGEEFSSGPLLVTLPEETCIVQSVHKVIPGSESGDVDKWCQNPEIYHSCAMESSDKCKQAQEYSDIETDDSHLFETRFGELDQSSSISELVPHTGIVSENKTLTDEGEVNLGAKRIQIVKAGSYEVGLEALNKSVGIAQEIRSSTAVLILEAEATVDDSYTVNAETKKQLDEEVASPILSYCDDTTVTVTEPQFAWQKDSHDVSTDDVLPIYFTVGNREEQSPVAEQGRVGGKTNTSESGEKNLADVMSTGLHTKDVVPIDFTIEEHEEQYSVSPVAVEKRVSREASASESAGIALVGILSTGLQTKNLQHVCDVLTKETGEGSKPEVHCDAIAEESILVADLGKCLSKGSKGNPLSTNLYSEGDTDDSILPVLNAAKGCSSDGTHSSFGLKLLFAEECKENYSSNEFVGLYMEADCSLAGKDMRLVADNPDDEQAIVQVQQGDVQEGTLEKPSLSSATPECKHEYGLPEEAVLHSMKNKVCLPSAEQSPFGLQSLFSQESIEKSVEYGSLASATAHTENGVGELKDCHVKCALEKSPLSGPVSRYDTQEGSCLMSKNDNGLPKSGHDEERGSSSLSDFLVDAKHREELINSEEVACKSEGSRKLVHSEGHSASCEKSDVNWPADNAYGISDAVPSSSLHAPANDNDDVCLGSTLAQLESTDFLDKMIGCSNTEVLHRGHKDRCNEDREEQVASGPCTNDIMEAATAKYIENGVVLLPAEERSNLKDGQLNSMLEGTKVMESGLNSNNDVSNTSDNGSVVGIVGKKTPSGSILPKDSPTDHYLRQELFDGFSVETSLEGSAILGEKIAPSVGATIGNPSFSLATPGYKHEGALSEEAVRRMKNYAGTCSSDTRQLLMELQSLFSKESTEEYDPLDGLAFPSAESGGDGSTVRHVEKLVGTLVSSEPDTYQGPRQDLSRAEEKEGRVTVSLEDNEQEGFLKSRQMKDWDLSSQFDLTEDAHHIERDIIAEEVLCEEKEKRKSMPTTDSDILHEKSHSNGYAEHASCASETQFCSSQKTSICDGLHLCPIESVDALDNDIPYFNTGVLHQHHKEEYYEHNEDQVTSGIHAMSEAAPIKVLDNGIALVQAVETSGLPDEQLNPELEGNKGICQSRGLKHKDEINSKLSSCDTEVLHQDHKEECNELNEDKVTPEVLENDMSEAALVEEMESAIMLLPVAVMSELLDEQLNPKLESDEGEEHSFSCDKDTIETFCTGSVKNELSHLPKDCHIDSCQKQEVPDNLSVPKSPEESANCQDENVLRSGPCQTSGKKCIDESSSMQLTSNIEAVNQDHEECNENNEDQITLGIPAINMSEAAQIERLERELGLNPSAGTSALPDEQLYTKLEGNEVDEHSCSYDKDTCSLFYTESVGNNKASNLPKDTHGDPSNDHDLPNDLSAPRCPKKSTIFQNDTLLGSVGISQSSRRRAVDKISTKLQSFKVSSTVKGSYIAMSAPRTKQGDNLSQSAIALLRNKENTPAVKADRPVKLNPDCSAAKDSSRRTLQPISGRPRDH